MSYCRWSSDDFGCDLYCYADCAGGWTTHVAGNRVVGEVPKTPSFMTTNTEEWLIAYKAQMAFLETAKRRGIGLQHDGKTFNDATLEDFLARLLSLREAGYRFPDYVIEEIKQEITQGWKK